MTNYEIITTEKAIHQIDLEVNTYPGWLREGCKVKAGEKAVFKTKIWKPCKPKKSEDGEEKKLYLVTAHYFTEKQVEKV